MPSNLRLKALVVAMGLAAGSAAFAATPAAVLANTTVVTRATQLGAGDSVVGTMTLTKSMRVTMSLRLRNEAQLDAFIANPHHPNLSHAEFMAKYGPSGAQVNQVKAFMRQQGFTNIHVTPDNMLVSGEAPVSTVQAAFHTSMVNVRTKDGRMAFANSTEARIPNALQGVVHEVLGLQNVHRFHVLPHTLATGTAAGHNPTQFASIYNAGSTATASTVNVGIITQGSMTNVLSDFKSFLSQNGLASIPMNVVKVDGGGSGTSGDGEWDLDSQDIVGISGGVKALYLYDTASLSTQDLVDDFSAATTANVVRVVNVSIGGCETSAETNGAATGDNVFQEADAEGMTFSVSSGDSGANECQKSGENPPNNITPSWPADSQYVVAVGGTELYTSGTTWESETVWNNLNEGEGAAGGSPSNFEAMPSWQQNVGQNAGHTTRGVPDVAFDGSPDSGATVIVDGSPAQWGGTSLASPLFVGVWARTLAANPNLGFAAPLIYADAASHYATDFHDVTSGNNNGETAAAGWDYTTGFGSINIANFIADVHSYYVHNDVNRDGKSDLIWRSNDNTQFAYWLMNGPQLASSLAIPTSSTYKVVATGDFNNDGKLDVIWTDGTSMWMWVGNGSTFSSVYMRPYPTGWTVVGTGDLNNDGFTDLIWANGNQIAEWLMNGTNFVASYSQTLSSGWRYIGVGDFDGDGKADLLLTNGSAMQMWTNFNNGSFTGVATHAYPTGWTFLGTGDVNGDGNDDLLWRDNSRAHFAYWIMSGPQLINSWSVAVTPDWTMGTSGDFNGDGLLDLVWYNGSQIVMWPGNSSGVYKGVVVQSYPSGGWTMLP